MPQSSWIRFNKSEQGPPARLYTAFPIYKAPFEFEVVISTIPDGGAEKENQTVLTGVKHGMGSFASRVASNVV